MIRTLAVAGLGILVAIASSRINAALPGDFAILVTHETYVMGADGVARTSRFNDRVVRKSDTVWIQRVITATKMDERSAQSGRTHRRLDLATSAQWIEKSGVQPPKLRLVNANDRVIVDVPPTEYANVGFDGKWSTAYHLLDPDTLRGMKISKRSAPKGARWYEGGSPGSYVRVLWDEINQYPLRVESGNRNGSARSLMVTQKQPMLSSLPWKNIEGYAVKEYSDYLD